ncbi:unnamed protein product [Arctogadus glacialis]
MTPLLSGAERHPGKSQTPSSTGGGEPRPWGPVWGSAGVHSWFPLRSHLVALLATSGRRTRGADSLPQASEEAAPLSGQRKDHPRGATPADGVGCSVASLYVSVTPLLLLPTRLFTVLLYPREGREGNIVWRFCSSSLSRCRCFLWRD